MKLCRKPYWVIFLAFFAGCGLEESDQDPLLIFSTTFDFNESEHEWKPGFAEYPAGPDDSTFYELKFAYTDELPESLLMKKSLMLSGNNRSKDLFMYLKRKITGLKPNTDYTITFNVELASNLNTLAPTNTASVYLKAGATHSEPKSVIESGYYVMNIDKGNQDSAGEDMMSLGDILTPANGTSYTLISRNNTMANSRYVASTNSDGELWLIIGTDSNLEGTTTVFYTRVNVVFSAS